MTELRYSPPVFIPLLPQTASCGASLRGTGTEQFTLACQNALQFYYFRHLGILKQSDLLLQVHDKGVQVPNPQITTMDVKGIGRSYLAFLPSSLHSRTLF